MYNMHMHMSMHMYMCMYPTPKYFVPCNSLRATRRRMSNSLFNQTNQKQ